MKRIITTITLIVAISLTVSCAYARPYRWQGNQRNTAGWQLMTPEERAEHQTKTAQFHRVQCM